MLRLPDPEGPRDGRGAAAAPHGPQEVPTPRQRTVPTAPPRRANARNPLFHIVDGTTGSGDSDAPPHTDAPPPDSTERRFHDECYACPVGSAFAAVRASQVQPETLAHLMAASRELLAAARSFMESLESSLDRPPRQHGRSQRIKLD